MGGRKGDQLEQWGLEHIDGRPTNNSGAVNEDGDLLVDNHTTGKRVYEMKSSVVNHGVTINKVHARQLLQRAVKLSREPVFIYKNADGRIVAITPLRVVENKWGYPHTRTEELKRMRGALQSMPLVVQRKGHNIRLTDKQLRLVMDTVGVCVVETKSIPWVVMDVQLWLELSMDGHNFQKMAKQIKESARGDQDV